MKRAIPMVMVMAMAFQSYLKAMQVSILYLYRVGTRLSIYLILIYAMATFGLDVICGCSKVTS